MHTDRIVIQPVGVIHSEITDPILRSDGDGITMKTTLRNVKTEIAKISTVISVIVIEPELDDLLDDIDGYSHVMVLY